MNKWNEIMEIAEQNNVKNLYKMLKPGAEVPNNQKFGVIIYKEAILSPDPSEIEDLLNQNGWSNSWRNGIFDFHHFHSNSHEVLVAYDGSTEVILGGEHGIKFSITAGDVIILPAGTGHKNLTPESNFACIGAYPKGKQYDMRYGNENNRTEIKKAVSGVPVPDSDPIYGKDGLLTKKWE